MGTLTLSAGDIGTGSLILVNRSHPVRSAPLPEEMIPFRPSRQGILLGRRPAQMLAEAFAALGCWRQIVPISGYRTRQEQETIYADCSRKNGERFAAKFVAIPDCSEHQTGLAVDLAENRPEIDLICPEFPRLGICQAFRASAARYGFIERYRAGREAVTLIAPEPWHFRYVGWPHSELIEREDVTLEEYIGLLRQYPHSGQHLRMRLDGQNVDISHVRFDATAPAVVKVPDGAHYEVSGDNEDGIIVTLWWI